MSELKLNEYQNQARETAIYPGKYTLIGLIYCGLKLSGEAGEFSEKVGKALRDDDIVNIERINIDENRYNLKDISFKREMELKSELGDILWYVANAAAELNSSLSDIAEMNLKKLSDRKARGVLKGSGDSR